MIKPHCFQKEWIYQLRASEPYQKINPPIVEKMIHALSLLQHLQAKELDFVFKGGTSLILLLETAYRFSVDLDIITQESRENIENILDKVVASSHFKGWFLDERRSYQTGIPKAHYRLEYDLNINQTSNYILLDILFEKHRYPVIHKKSVVCPWIESEESIEVNIPTIEGITGDKLTAFAPTTTGILYGKEKELEIIKQMADLGNLINGIKLVDQVAIS